MGISGLLKQLESISNKKHLSEYKGKRIAVDGYCWLHKSIYLIKSEVFENPNSTKYINYLNRRIDSLIQNQITPVIIFDGDKLPMKKEEEEDRQRKRQENQRYARELFHKGLDSLARQKMIESMDINPEMAYMFIKELKKKQIEFYVAPYEADAQLAYLSQINYVDLVITEDSDLLALGCKKVLFKLDLETGFGDEINLEDLPKCRELDFTLFDHDKFLQYCILSGCDYFKLKGVGYKTAYQIVRERNNYKEVLKYFRLSNKCANIPYNLEELFEKAFLTFKFQVVYCPKEKKLRHYNDIQNTSYEFINKIYDEETTINIVNGKIDPISHKKFGENHSDIVSKMFSLNKWMHRKNESDKEKLDSNVVLNVNESKRNKENFKIIAKDDQKVLNQDEIEEINAIISTDNNLQLDFNINQTESDNKNSPDSIQKVSISMSQSQKNNFKRKSPYSNKDNKLITNKDNVVHLTRLPQAKRFKITSKEIKRVKYTSAKSEITNVTYNDENNDINLNKYKLNKPEVIDLISEEKIQESPKSLKSDKTEEAFECSQLFDTYDNARNAIKTISGDKNKLESINFNIGSNNKIVVNYDKFKNDIIYKQKLIINECKSNKVVCNLISNDTIDEVAINKDEEDSNFKINLDEYSLNTEDHFLKKDFLAKSFNLRTKKNPYI